MKNQKKTFQERVKEMRENREKIYEEMKAQADDPVVQEYYKNPENTPFIDLDLDIEEY